MSATATTSRLAELIAAGHSLRAVAAQLGLSCSRVFRLAKRLNLKLRTRRLSQKQRQRIVQKLRETRLSDQQIAAQVGVHRTTVYRLRVEKPQRETLAEPRRCPAGHLVNQWPCVECVPDVSVR